MPTQRRLDFAGLNAEAADLHLLVGAAQMFKDPVGAPAPQIPGPAKALATAKRRGHEPLGRQRRASEVTARETDAADIDFASHADGDRLEIAVEDVHLGVGDRPAGRNAKLPRALSRIITAGVEAFGHPVDVDERSIRRAGAKQVRK